MLTLYSFTDYNPEQQFLAPFGIPKNKMSQNDRKRDIKFVSQNDRNRDIKFSKNEMSQNDRNREIKVYVMLSVIL